MEIASAEEEEAEGEGGSSQNDKALGLTMMGAIFMIMGMFYLAHWPDHDIRKITWSTINNTISIFCAVILFKNVSEVCGLAFSFTSGSSANTQLVLNRVFTAFWYCLLFFSIYSWAGGLGRGIKWRQDVIRRQGLKTLSDRYSVKHPSLVQISSRMKCCLCLAHTTGFAGLYGWGMKTNTPWYNETAWHCAWLIPKAIVWYYLVLIVLMLCRRWFIGSDFVEKAKAGGKKDKLLAQAEEQLEDGENDFLGLFLSFLIVTTLRFGIGGNLPNEEAEEGEMVFKHTLFQVVMMYLVSGLFFFCAYKVLVARRTFAKEHKHEKAITVASEAAGHKEKQKGKSENEEEEEEEEEEDEEEHVAFTWLAGKIWAMVISDAEWHAYLRTLTAKMLKRLVDILVNMMSFSFAWCFMYATQWLLAPFFDGEELILGIVLAIVITILSCILVYILDKMADETEERSTRSGSGRLVPEEEDVVCRKLMESTGILIGFVWEQCFDVAVAGVAGENDLLLKPCLALLTVLVIVPVWLWYIIPMEINGGYILGVLPQTVNWRLKHMDLDAEPEVRAQVKEHLEGVMAVLKQRNPALMNEIAQEIQQWTKDPVPYHPPPVVPLHVPACTSPGASPTGMAQKLGQQPQGSGAAAGSAPQGPKSSGLGL